MPDDESRWEGNVVDVQVTENVVDLEVTEIIVEIEALDNVVEVAAVGMQGRPGPPGPAGPAGSIDVTLDTEVDESTPGVTYVGQAEPGTAKSDAAWRIKRVTETGPQTSIDWAGGTADYVHIWDDRLTLSYGP